MHTNQYSQRFGTRFPLEKGSSVALLAEVFVKVVEHRSASRDTLLIIFVGHREAGNEMSNAARLLAAEFGVLQVNVVHDVADRAERRVVKAGSREQHLERAAIPLMGKLGIEHIKAQF